MGAWRSRRCGVLLGNSACPQTKTLTHVLWSLLNSIPAKNVQRPHRHNSVALDLGKLLDSINRESEAEEVSAGETGERRERSKLDRAAGAGGARSCAQQGRGGR